MSRKRKTGHGFSLVEVAIALCVIAIFLLPYLNQSISIRRQSIAAHETVVANSLLFACLETVKGLPFEAVPGNDPIPAPFQTLFQEVRKSFSNRQIGSTIYLTEIQATHAKDPDMKIISLETRYMLPGTSRDKMERTLKLTSFIFRKRP